MSGCENAGLAGTCGTKTAGWFRLCRATPVIRRIGREYCTINTRTGGRGAATKRRKVGNVINCGQQVSKSMTLPNGERRKWPRMTLRWPVRLGRIGDPRAIESETE